MDIPKPGPQVNPQIKKVKNKIKDHNKPFDDKKTIKKVDNQGFTNRPLENNMDLLDFKYMLEKENNE